MAFSSSMLMFAEGEEGSLTPTGGVITTDGLYKVHTFSTSGTFSYIYTIPVEYLIVAGGGGGGGNIGSGGGAGGFLTNLGGTKANVTGNLPVVVGTGGAGGIVDDATGYGHQGGNSSFNGIVSVGGGGGMCRGVGTAYNGYGPEKDGGSGGGGADKGLNYPGADNIAGGTGTALQGNNGGASGGWGWSSGGGGGAGGPGGTGNTPYNGQWGGAGNGGDGLTSAISGTNLYYAGGGGGGMYNGNNPAEGGAGGGGRGGTAPFPTVVRTDGTDGLGGGGGGGGGGETGGDGGNGIVIIRYLISDLT